jgi:hypothetical protein
MIAVPLEAGAVNGLDDRFQRSTPLSGGGSRIARLDGDEDSTDDSFFNLLGPGFFAFPIL